MAANQSGRCSPFAPQTHQRQSRTSRVDQLELQLRALAAQTEVRMGHLSGSVLGSTLILTVWLTVQDLQSKQEAVR